ncbi:hypothetical protein ACCO45_007304 [Purpureocillium lilacinum]|uniref:Uncharacterized protein n=1 Tax=Purpureocillium lilacinum TaxID=33203 RepID=A0ACC4DSV4_PURLI
MKVCISTLALALALGSANASAILQGDPMPVPGPEEDESTLAYWAKYAGSSGNMENWIKVCRTAWGVKRFWSLEEACGEGSEARCHNCFNIFPDDVWLNRESVSVKSLP